MSTTSYKNIDQLIQIALDILRARRKEKDFNVLYDTFVDFANEFPTVFAGIIHELDFNEEAFRRYIDYRSK